MQGGNRVPSVVRERVGTKPDSALDFLSFKDWDSRKENEATDWTLVARKQVEETKGRRSDFFTFSALAMTDGKNPKKIVSNSEWDVTLEFGHPTFYTMGFKGKVIYDPGARLEKNGFVFKPFVFFRSTHGYAPDRFELVQDFMLYHDAYYDSAKSEYQRIDEDGEIHTVVRLVQNGANLSVLVDTHDLKDYLAANQCHLVRYHDNMRWTTEEIPRLGNGKRVKKKFKGNAWAFDLSMTAESLFEWKNFSLIRGKDIVPPYDKPDARHTSFADMEDHREYAKFIVGRDKKGKSVESTCDESKLSNYFSDLGTPHVLTPIYFKRGVLSKYYQETKRFTIGDSRLACLDLWGIDFDVTKEGLVQVWLYDLGHIPYKEQLYWRTFNVEPKGTITEHRWRRDFAAEFADSDDPVEHFKRALEDLQTQSAASLGSPIILQLDEQDRYVLASLHLPLTEEPGELDAQIQSLAKITVDSLSVELLEKRTGSKIDGKTTKGSIDLLQLYLQGSGFSGEEIASVVRALKAIQSLRSTGSAHRKGENFRRTTNQLGLEGLANADKMKRLLLDATTAFLLLKAKLGQGQ